MIWVFNIPELSLAHVLHACVLVTWLVLTPTVKVGILYKLITVDSPLTFRCTVCTGLPPCGLLLCVQVLQTEVAYWAVDTQELSAHEQSFPTFRAFPDDTSIHFYGLRAHEHPGLCKVWCLRALLSHVHHHFQ